MSAKELWISAASSLAIIAIIVFWPISPKRDASHAASGTATPVIPSPLIATKSGGTATVVGPPVMSPGNIISIPVIRKNDGIELSAILCIKCRESLFVPGVGDRVTLEWTTFRQNPKAPPVEFLTATEYRLGHP